MTALGPTTANPLGLGSLQVRGWDPALIVFGARCHSWAIFADDGSLINWVDGLGAARRFLRTLAAFAAALLLREESRNPGVVDEVAGPTEAGGEEEVQEDAVMGQSRSQRPRCSKKGLLHLRVED